MKRVFRDPFGTLKAIGCPRLPVQLPAEVDHAATLLGSVCAYGSGHRWNGGIGNVIFTYF